MPDSRTPRRLEQITATFRALGVDNVTTWWDRSDRLTHCRAAYSDGDGSIIVHMTSPESDIPLMILVGQEMQRKLKEQRPNLELPDVVWT